MAKIIEVAQDTITIGADDGSIKEVRTADLNFVPHVGDKVEIFETENRIIVSKAEEKKDNPTNGININMTQTPNNIPSNGYMPQQQSPNNPVSGCSVTAMILGLIAILASCCFYYISIPCAIIGVILAAVGMKSGKGGKGMAIAGLVLSIISLVPAIIVMSTGAAIISAFS